MNFFLAKYHIEPITAWLINPLDLSRNASILSVHTCKKPHNLVVKGLEGFLLDDRQVQEEDICKIV